MNLYENCRPKRAQKPGPGGRSFEPASRAPGGAARRGSTAREGEARYEDQRNIRDVMVDISRETVEKYSDSLDISESERARCDQCQGHRDGSVTVPPAGPARG